ncbi:MAG: S24/S26 family peptidase [Oscillospiraceae bacterium]|nr:S24/S26 family peptidase [Oscillospiraceae bacterium]
MGKAQYEELEKNGFYFSVPHGVSMWPLVLNKQGILEIHRLERPARRYDFVLYSYGGEQGILHRVLHVREKDYVIAGDNCWRKEYVPKENVVGIVTRFYRKGKWYEVTDPRYLLYVHLWTDFFFIRRPLLYLRDRLKRCAAIAKRKLLGAPRAQERDNGGKLP